MNDRPMTADTKVEMPCSSKSESEMHICGLNLSTLSRNNLFVLCVVGIFVAYLLYGALQEAIFTESKMKVHSLFLTLYQFSIYAFLSYIELISQHQLLTDHQPARVSLNMYGLLAVLSLGTIAFSNASVGFLNYPTQVIFKCCKMIPVMLGGILIQNKRYNGIEVSAVLCMTVGLIFFTLVDVTVQPTFNIVGIILVSIALCCDGALGNLQELVMRKLKATNTEILFYSYSIGFLVLLIGLVVSGQFLPSLNHFLENPVKTFGYGFVFSVCGYFGIHFVLALVHSHGALTAVTVTTLRKGISIVISFILFEKPFSMGYLWSGLLVLCGIYLNLYNKQRNKWDAFFSAQFKRFWSDKSLQTPILPV